MIRNLNPSSSRYIPTSFFYLFDCQLLNIPSIQIDEIVFLRSHLVPHYVGTWSGHRFSLIHFTYQVVFDFVQKQKGFIPFLLE